MTAVRGVRSIGLKSGIYMVDKDERKNYSWHRMTRGIFMFVRLGLHLWKGGTNKSSTNDGPPVQ